MLCDPSSTADFEFNSSVMVTSPLIHEIIHQRTYFSATVLSDQRQAKVDVVSSRHQQQASRVSELAPLLPDNCIILFNCLVRKVPHLGCQCFPLKNMALHYIKVLLGMLCVCNMAGWLPSGLPAKCVCGHGFTELFIWWLNLGTSPQLLCLKFVTMWLLSQFCSLYLVNLCIMPWPMWSQENSGRDWTCSSENLCSVLPFCTERWYSHLYNYGFPSSIFFILATGWFADTLQA